jgi:Flp pilus assembly protein TadG
MTMNILSEANSEAYGCICRVHPRTKQMGQSAVEMALTLPLLLLILFGLIISVFTFYAYIQVSNAAREGARAGSLYRITYPSTGSPTPSLLTQTVQKAIYDSSLNPPVSALGTLPVTASSFNVVNDVGVVYSGDATNPRPGDVVTVTVGYSYTMPIVSAALPMFPQPLRIVRTVVMEVQ